MKTKVVLGILILLVVSPVLGTIVPWLHAFIPMAYTFAVPVDGPPFAETVLPLIGVLSILIGITAFFIYVLSCGRIRGGLIAFCCFHIFYSSLALIFWLIFFGCRFVRYFFVTEIGFYAAFIFLTVPHIVWISFLVYSIRTLKNKAANCKQEKLPETEAVEGTGTSGGVE